MDRTSLVSYQEQVVVIGLDGQLRILSEGSQPSNGEIIVERVSQSELKVGLVKDEQSTDISDDIAQIIETLESGQDPTQLSEEFATAAGTANGSSYQLTATLERSASEILAATDFQTSGLQDLGVSQTQTLSLLEAYRNFNQVISSASGNPDTLAPSVPTVVITEDSNNDGSLENNEIDGLVDVLVTLPANAEVGDTLSVTGQPDRVITQNDLDNGVTLQYPVPAEGETLTVVATVTDQAGNTSEPGQDTITVPTVETPDTVAPDTPTVVITEDSNNDGLLENNEVDGLVDVLVTLPADAEVGDTLSVTGQPDRVITQNDLDNGVTLQYPVPAEGETLTVVATITDQAGNTSEPGQDAVTVPTVEVPDTDAPDAPTVVITEDSNNDGSLENNEVDGLVDVLVTLPANAEVGDTLSVTGQPDRVITQNDLDNGVTLQYPVSAEGETLTVVATITDQAGNTSEPGQDAVTVPTVEVPDTDAPDAPTVVITEDSNNDGSLESNEVDGLVDVLVTLPANAEVGDTLSVTGQPDRVITQNDLDNGVTLQYPVPAEGETLTVVATVTDQAGNTSGSGQDAVTVPVNEAPTASIDLDPIVVGDDNVINQAEATGQVTLTGTVGGEVVEGDTVQLKLGDNLLAEVEVIKLADGKLGFSADVDASTLAGFNDQSVTASVTITDDAGNAVTATDSETYQVDVDAPTASIDLDPIVVGNDNTINEAESTGKVTLSGTVGGDVKVGDTVTLALGENLLTTAKVIDLGNDQLGFSVDVDASDLVGFDGKSVTASVTVTDEAGNSVEKSDTETYLVDVDAPTTSIDLDPIVVGNDNTINEAESTGKVTLSGTVGGDVKIGDTVTLALGENLLTTVKVVDLGNDQLGFSVDVDASDLVGFDGKSVTASVTVTDEAGNSVEKSDTETYLVDVDAPTASIDLDPIVVGDDNVINQAEATGQVTLTGTVGGEVVEGDTVQLKLGDNLLAEVEVIKLADGKLGFSADVDASTLAGFNDQSVTASVTITDDAGNAVTATDSETYQVDVAAPTASINLDPIVVGNDNTINEAESTGKVTLSGTVGGDVKIGDTVTLALGENLLTTVKVVDLGNDQLGFSVDVDASELVGFDGKSVTASVTVTDEAGNSVEKSDTETYQVDVAAPAASINLDPIVVGDDNVINQAEATGQVTLTGAVGGEVVEGDTVQLKLGDNLLAEVEVIKLADGKLGFSADVDASTLAGFNDQSVTASVTITDDAGNAVTATDSETYQVDVDAPTASINLDPIVVGDDNVINQAEATGQVTLTGTVGGEVVEGDTVQLKLGDNLLAEVEVIKLADGKLGFSADVDASTLAG
ncbi:Ig-like domain-containing protein, partial [Vibrio rotiferianus]|uniref:Ig-like domain-containing protein n=3 Tax=Vibrio rotiferianus TaxID=190895 RepID=UPI00390BD3EE